MQSATLFFPSWQSSFGRYIDRIRINEVRLEHLNGTAIWMKRRTPASLWLVPVANRFFRLAGNPVRVFTTDLDWQEREVKLFRLLNGRERKAEIWGSNTTYAEVLPGRDLVALLETGLLNQKIMEMTGSAFRRMHGVHDPETGKLFSHGDPHLGNVIYDAQTEKVGWIDFETAHLSTLTTVERQADDLLVFLQDLAGRTEDPQWKFLSWFFLKGYAGREVLAVLKRRLHLPIGLGAIWWAVRTSYLPRRELRRRIDWLRETL